MAYFLGRLPDEEADLLRRRFYGGRSQSEIAAETGIPLGTVKMRMVQALARLRELMDEEEGAS
jgi:RNA polymerase sigma-70 factor (ECF subfamily)